MKDKATYSTRDQYEAARLFNMGYPLLASADECEAWGEWPFGGEETALAAVRLKLTEEERRWLDGRDRSLPPAVVEVKAKALREVPLCAAMYTGGGLTEEEAEDVWGMDGGGVELDADRLKTTWRPGGQGMRGAASKRAEQSFVFADQAETAARNAMPDFYERDEPFCDEDPCDEEDDGEDNQEWLVAHIQTLIVPNLWDIFLDGREAWDRLHPEIAEQRRQYRARVAREEAAIKAQNEAFAKTGNQLTLWVTTERVAELLGIKLSGVQHWRERHNIPTRLEGGRNLYRLEDVLEYIVGRKLFGPGDQQENEKYGT